ncbi:MAG: tyrosine-protein phosphatase YwqE [Alphaproteobacteria bacterium]|jgi:tyrosine-protein phosphatase YwqE
MPEQKCQDLLHLFRLIGKPAVQAVVNYVSFCHTCLYKIQRRTNVPAIRQSEQYKRHRPETTLLYQLVERYYPSFTVNLAEQGKYLPKYVKREFDEFLRCRPCLWRW